MSRAKLTSLLEILGVFITGTLAARLIARALPLPTASLRDLEPGATIDYMQLAASTAASLTLRYGIMLALAFAIGWWLFHRKPAAYGVTTTRSSLAIGIVLFAVGGFLPKLLIFARDHVDLGAAPKHWQLIQSPSSLDFWIYMAVSSFLLVPIVEELFFRGYVQTRVADGFGAPAAIVMTAILFTLSHRQYFLPSILGAGMLLSLLFAAILAGYVRQRYGSLLPVILAHALGNVPVRGNAQIVLLIAMLFVIGIARRPIAEHLGDLVRLLKTREIWTAMAIATAMVVFVLGIAAAARVLLAPLGVLALVASLALSRARSAAPV